MAKYNAVNYNLIYVYSIADDAHKGLLKIGKTSFYSGKSVVQLFPMCPELNIHAHKRIQEQTKTALVDYQLEYTELAVMTVIMDDGSKQYSNFEDKDVHEVLYKSGFSAQKFVDSGVASEWFAVDLATATAAIKAVKDGLEKLPSKENPNPQKEKTVIKLRDEQKDAVKKTETAFMSHDDMLWDCKMRFGKTVTAYELIRRANEHDEFKKVIVVTHRPAVEDGWGSDHGLIFEKDSHVFIDKTNGKLDYDGALDAENDRRLKKTVASGKPFVYFASIQDLRGSARVGGKFNKNNAVFDLDWDLIVIDEAHEGTRTELGDAVIRALKKEHTKVLSLSGTPYNIMGDFGEENKYSWSYVDEQKAKAEWDEKHPGEKNPYAELPTMNIYTFDLTEQIPDSYRYVTEDSAFNFREFFRVWTGDKDKDYRAVPDGAKVGDFVHAEDVYNFLSLISKEDPESNYPFATEEFRDMFAHTFWLVPGVKEAKALSAMLKVHPRFKDYYVVNIAGDGDEEQPYDEALGLVKAAIKSYPKTISISCGKLTTGVTVREWTGVMMLSGSASTAASGYMQAIFRVQSPGCINGRQKTNCYVFDFAPDRTLKVIAEVHHLRHKRGAGEDETAKQVLGEFLNFCPVIAIEGTVMRAYDVPEMMRQIKKISVEAAINSGFDDDTIYKTDAGIVVDQYDAEILRKLSDVVAPQKKGKKKPEIDLAKNGMTAEERKVAENAKKKKPKERTPEEQAALEKEKQQQEERKKMLNLLRAVSIRLPLLFYGADADITEIIHLKDFVQMVDDESWQEFMPKGLKKELFLDILRYYDEDVVTGAGLRIRKLAKAADELPPMLRAKRIVEIMSRFKNPDKETVLTPWRVVNMHMGDTIGGMNFYDETYTKELDEPRMVEQLKITEALLLNENVKILEMNSKSGLYPLYVAYSIYYMYVDGDELAFPLEKAQEIWFRTLEKNIFILCKTKMAQAITTRTLTGYSGKSVNAIYLPHLIDSWMKEKQDKLVNKLRNPNTWGKEGEQMTFDAVVGNPPYQISDGGQKASAIPIYNSFVDIAKAIHPNYISMIMPSRWMSGGRGLDSFRSSMLNDKSIEKLFDYTDSSMIFPGVDVAGGICYFLWNRSYYGDCCFTNIHMSKRETMLRSLNQYPFFIRFNTASIIISKIEAMNNLTCDTIVSSQKPFGMRTYVTPEENGDLVLRYSGGLGPISSAMVTSNTEWIKKWKVISSYLTHDHAGEFDRDGKRRIISTLEILPPKTVCTETYIVLYTADNESEAKAYVSYVKTHFFRFLLAQLATTQHLSKGSFSLIPLQDFTATSDINWSQTVEKIDAQLYAKYGLTQEEIDYIESMIKTME